MKIFAYYKMLDSTLDSCCWISNEIIIIHKSIQTLYDIIIHVLYLIYEAFLCVRLVCVTLVNFKCIFVHFVVRASHSVSGPPRIAMLQLWATMVLFV